MSMLRGFGSDSPLILREGTPDDKAMWSGLYWLYDGGIPDSLDVAIRQKRADGLWYVTYGTLNGTVEVAGPTASVEAATMLLLMGVTR